ncbi:metal-sensing transcriptional repressor [Gluconobacter sp.]|uniref:metal-sensing transcriptional repressor n=1 Tax=Gluconobacter sp. TaxID=1876758 RepID=UPI0039ED0C2C
MAPSYPPVEQRLKQAHGHLAKIMTMLAEQRSCEDVIQQIQAVESTVHSAKRLMIQEHVGTCILEKFAEGDLDLEGVRQEFAAFSRYL